MKTIALKKPSFSAVADNRVFLIRSLWMALHSFLLIGFIGYQFVQPLFLNATTWIWAYLCLFLCFVSDFMFFYSQGFKVFGLETVDDQKSFFKNASVEWPVGRFFSSWLSGPSWLCVDVILMTLCLSMVLPALSSVLLFVYILSIFSAGWLGQYKGALAQGFLVSFLYSCVLVFQPAFAESYPSLIVAFILNNIGFMAVAGLSGFFGAQAIKRDWLIGIGDKVHWELENLNQLIVENMNMGLLILDEDTQIIHSNNQARKMLELPEGFSAPIHRLFPEIREQIISNQQDVHRLQLEYQARLGVSSTTETKSIEVFISPIKNMTTLSSGWGSIGPKKRRDHKPAGHKSLILFQDMTHVRELEKKQREKEKLAGIGRMAVGIAHEIRNPLSSVGGSIQLLDLDKENNKAENKRLMDIALREISRLNGIIGEFLSYTADESSLENLQTESIDINTVLEDLLDSVRVNPHWDHIKHHALLKAKGMVEGRVDKFKQIFWNVVKNACEAMSQQAEGFLTLESFDDHEWVVVRVKDSGCGISDKDKPFIYEPFYSKKEKGSGLGLAIARKLVLFYKGVISHQPVEKGGTLFEVRFPLQSNPLPSELAQKAS